MQQAFASYPPGADFTRLHEDRIDVWLRHALHAPDQLRQRVSFALSEIMVISQLSPLVGYPWGSASYYDTLARIPSASTASRARATMAAVMEALAAGAPLADLAGVAQLRDGVAPRELIVSGAIAARELEHRLRELARRGAVRAVRPATA